MLQRAQQDYGSDAALITCDDGETVESTFHHPYWVVEGQNLDERPQPDQVPTGAEVPGVQGRWVDAGDVREGDVLLSRSGLRTTVTEVRLTPVYKRVYHLYVDNLHNFTVGNGQWLVHNGHNGNTHYADWDLYGPGGKRITGADELSGVDFPLNGRRLSFPEQSWHGHTEGKIIDDLWRAGKLKPGTTLVINGQLPACSNCRGIMKWTSEAFDITVVYRGEGIPVGWMGGTALKFF